MQWLTAIITWCDKHPKGTYLIGGLIAGFIIGVWLRGHL